MPFPLLPETATLRNRAYFELHVTPEQVAMAPQITPQLRAITRTLKRAGQHKIVRKDEAVEIQHAAPYGPGLDIAVSWPHYLSSSDHADAKKVLLTYHGLHIYLRKVIPIEAFCVAAGVSPLTILGILTGEIVRMGAQASTIIAAVNHPRVVQKSVEMALTDDGLADRTLLAKATGFLPTPKGSQTNINIAANATAQAAPQIVVVAPPPEATIRRAVDRFNDAKELPPAPNLPDYITTPAIAVEVDDEDDEA